MTKPADQIAKAQAFWNEWVNGPDGGESLFLTSSNQSRTVFKFAIAFAESERQAVIEECAKVAESMPGAKDDEELWTPITERIATAIRSME